MLSQRYRERCREVGRKPDMRSYHSAHNLGRAFMKECAEEKTEKCPFIIIDIDGYFSYFVKMVEDTVYPVILTTDELKSIGYTKEEYDESYDEDESGDEG